MKIPNADLHVLNDQPEAEKTPVLWHQKHFDVEQRIGKIEWWKETAEKHIENTDSNIEIMRSEVKNMAPKPRSAGSLIVSILPFVLVLAGFIWQAARYPDRAEFNVMKADSDFNLRAFREEQAQVRVAVYTTIEIVKRLEERQEKLDDKLEVILQRRR